MTRKGNGKRMDDDKCNWLKWFFDIHERIFIPKRNSNGKASSRCAVKWGEWRGSRRSSIFSSLLSLSRYRLDRSVRLIATRRKNQRGEFEKFPPRYHPPRYSVKDKPYPFPLFDFRELPFSDSIPRPRKDYLFTDILRVGALTIGNKLHGELGETETAASYFSGSRRVSNANQSVPVASRTERRGEIGSA